MAAASAAFLTISRSSDRVPPLPRVESVPLNVPGFSKKVDNHPVVFSELNGRRRKTEEFTAPQSTTNQKSEDRVVASAPKTIPLRVQQQRPALIGSEPVAQSHTDSAYALDSADADGCSVPQTSSVRDRVRQEIASAVSSFSGVWAFWPASCAAFSQNCRQTTP